MQTYELREVEGESPFGHRQLPADFVCHRVIEGNLGFESQYKT